ncbi:hypothetical protein F2P56_010241 [Juglans regia]|uniref:RING-type E3 ubiquitin transferase n=2 Tax=Juglans regia TaxID=51240 RepID=A0A2I4H388_JUGRE|nr:RING-H2 finger protein ATL51-like [Juglans regia]KAF5473641.1 hypothetical protein F2P56_010241 [Juglans regia]
MVEADSVRLLPYCRHAFHVPCIDKWFSAHFNCPIYRAPMAAAPIIMENPLPIEIQISAHVEGGDDGVDNISASTLRRHVRSGGLPRHCPASLVLPKEGKRPRRLKRSFSMGQSYVAINIRGESEKTVSAASTSSSSSSCSIKDVTMQSSRPYRSASCNSICDAVR